jgi:uncharacterized membrane protein
MAAPGSMSTIVIDVKNTGGAPLIAPVATLSPSVPANALALVAANDNISGRGDLNPGQARSVEIKFTPPAAAAAGTIFKATLTVTGTNLAAPKTVAVQAQC